MTDIRLVKTELRASLKAKRMSLAPEEKLRRDEKIQHRFMNLWQYRECGMLLTYVSTPQEIDTHVLIKQSLLRGKTVLAPRCVPGTRSMDFCLITSFEQLVPGSFGVLEPDCECEIVSDFSGALCVVPGLSFDKQGFRLGYGKGYYDRFLACFSGTAAGFAYSDFLVPELPAGRYDRAVSFVITEKDIVTVKGTEFTDGR